MLDLSILTLDEIGAVRYSLHLLGHSDLVRILNEELNSRRPDWAKFDVDKWPNVPAWIPKPDEY